MAGSDGHRQRFRAMGTDCQVVVHGGPPDLAATLVRRVHALAAAWTRFDPGSEVSRLNANAGSFVSVSAPTAALVERAVEGWVRTAGRFDPTVLGAVVRAGYDRDFADVARDPRGGCSDLRPGCADIVVRGRQVRLPPGTGFDPGGIAKGLAADLVVAEAARAGAAGACVNLGGDVRVAGRGPAGDGWTVDVVHPTLDRPLATLGLTDGAVATSTTLVRRWKVGGEERSHVIDPRTGRPTSGPISYATVVAGEGWLAEVLATEVVLTPTDAVPGALAAAGAEGLAVTSDGRVRATTGLAPFLGHVPLPAVLSDLSVGAVE